MNTGGECKHNDNRVESTSKNKPKIAIQKEYIDKSNYLYKNSFVFDLILFYQWRILFASRNVFYSI